MSSSESAIDFGLLSPGYAGTGAFERTCDLVFGRAMLDVESALAAAQARAGIIPQDCAQTIADVVARFELDTSVLATGVRDTANPVVQLVVQLESAVAAVDERAAGFLHYGSTSQDVLDTAIMLVSARVLEDIGQQLGRCTEALLGLIERFGDLPAAARTLTQHAVPTTFGLRAATWLRLVLDGAERVVAVRAALPVCMGGAAGTLSAYAEYASARTAGRVSATDVVPGFARELGLTARTVPWHGIRTPYLDLVHAIAVVTGGLGKIAADVLVLSRTEIGEVAEPGSPGRGQSSAMPQKRNPVLATLITTAARQLPAQALVVMQAMACEDERSAGAWHTEWQPIRECLRLCLGASSNAALLTEGLTVMPERMLENLKLTGAAIVAERLAAALAADLPKAMAKKVVTRAVGNGAADGAAVLATIGSITGREDLDIFRRNPVELFDPTRYLGQAADTVQEVVGAAPDVLDALSRMSHL
jgi:3-carboxy-cis,cis-muconate cycloisomerase